MSQSDDSNFQPQKQAFGYIYIISGEKAINWGLSKPMLRAFRTQWDLCKINNYECYNEFD